MIDQDQNRQVSNQEIDQDKTNPDYPKSYTEIGFSFEPLIE
jgi:hypothetical protein